MSLTIDHVLALAPDASSASAAKKLAHRRHWRSTGRSETALWGACQGTALFPDLMAAAIQRRDLTAWAAHHDIAAARPSPGATSP